MPFPSPASRAIASTGALVEAVAHPDPEGRFEDLVAARLAVLGPAGFGNSRHAGMMTV